MKFYALLLLAIIFTSCGKDDDSNTNTDPEELVRIDISSIVLNSYPGVKPDGQNWDIVGGADPYMIMQRNAEIIHTTGISQEANSTAGVNFTKDYVISDLNALYEFFIYDSDPDADDFMMSWSFTGNELDQITETNTVKVTGNGYDLNVNFTKIYN